jgi:anthranilate synthase component 1
VDIHPKDKAAQPGAAPYFLKVPADLTTPVRAFLALTRPGEDAFLLESVAGGEAQARYSFLGFKPAEIFLAGREARRVRNGQTAPLVGSPAEAFQSWITTFETMGPKTPAPFMGGAVGWMDFSAFALSEPVLETSFPSARDPRVVFGLFSAGLVFDHLRQEAWLYKIPAAGEDEGDCLRELEHRRQELEAPIAPPSENGVFAPERSPDRTRFSRNLAAVQSAILAGDAYQVVISEPFEGSFGGNPFEVYRRLRRLNPSPYHFYVSLGGRQVVGASPEMLIRVEDDRATTVPIAGTRRRGATPDEDRALEESLVGDPKELAEHAMLVDLARNDLGRVCAFGSVEVPVRASVERFSHVMHLTSEVQGRLASGRTALDALLGTFPAGTVSGAPKIRAVQILSELEGEDRGVYGGAVGTVDTSGNLETCIAIRTLEFEAGRVRFRAGAGIVADSREASEWEEIHHKAGVMLQALGGDSKEENK